ncbi:3-hydroxyacyl-CoA dehydrogenase [Nocardia higoensis]|uniref:3-hydroxyacyl-CoA dehydrogenase n=1 Tax=Nocardia higoensis TaxID=228599 RepID=UPI0002FDA733|nr:3-hydroxyacyl-CoA dehydrogenase [Nocardia higoensis]
MTTAPKRVAIAGAGSIGIAFAIRFAASGLEVQVWDPIEEALPRGSAELDDRLGLLAGAGVLTEAPEVVRARIGFTHDLTEALREVELIQECAPEKLELKQRLFREAAAAAPTAVLASSSSAITPSRLADGLDPSVARRLLVAHPANPPYVLPIIELVPSPRTCESVLGRAEQLYRAAGLRPVLVRHEPEGFIFNRLQGAVLREAYCLVRDGVATLADVDEVMRSGLGRRWSIMGPFETADLNTRGGLASHAEKMGPAYARMGAERGQDDPWTPELVAEAVRQRRAILPMADWEARVRWRDEQLLQLTGLWDHIADPRR